MKRATSLLALLAACGGDREPDRPPDIVLVCVDTLRADHTSLHGYGRPTTPSLEEIAAAGTWYTRHVTNASWTKPSVASMLTGLPPTAHGSRTGQFVHPERGSDRRPEVELLSERHFTLPEVLAEHGYETCAHVTNYNMVARFGYAQGYDDYRFELDATAREHVHRSDREAIEFVRRKLEGTRKPVFAWLHLMSVHQYAAPPLGRLFRSRSRTPVDEDATASRRMEGYTSVEQAVDDYDDAVRHCDRLIGELWDWLRAERPGAVLIVTSDHGEEFGEHGGFEHGSTLYGEQLWVPLVIAGGPVGVRRVDRLTDGLDLFPTVLDLAGIPAVDPDLPGRTLLGPDPGKGRSFAEQHARGPWRRLAVTTAEEDKLILSTRKRDGRLDVEYYEDPFAGEREERYAGGEVERLRELYRALEAYRERVEAEFERRVGERRTTVLEAAEVEVLHGLGYAGGFGDEE